MGSEEGLYCLGIINNNGNHNNNNRNKNSNALSDYNIPPSISSYVSVEVYKSSRHSRAKILEVEISNTKANSRG